MTMLRHPLSGTEYHFEADDTVRVVGKNGVEGRFTRHGVWISGARRTADPAMCQWVADARLIRPITRAQQFENAKADSTRTAV